MPLIKLILMGDEWAEEKVESASMLKLIYHGRFLHGSVTLNALNLPQGKTTTRCQSGNVAAVVDACCRSVGIPWGLSANSINHRLSSHC
ncbi:hypothetical protein TELCIR_06246 [Teladorsagia circumcincta]|uniref:UBL3-like ubiquitin domain-containing protein n=1 Tax=Teladorsagia circumcincta TaxID=45464 RepID=A0A2G9UNK3_TELCI|nr:hypothetical protein TELCIR_06246 [Teladorsagia circumcincta]